MNAKDLNEKDGECAGRGFDVRALRDRLVLSKGGELLNSSFVMMYLRFIHHCFDHIDNQEAN